MSVKIDTGMTTLERRAGSPVIESAEHEAFSIAGGSFQAGVIFLCDHASNRIPPEFGSLGLPRAELERHIAYDIGTETMTRVLADAFDAPAVFSCFSRLLIDPNRGADDPTLVMRISDGALIEGNARIDEAGIAARIERFHAPYHRAIASVVDRALAAGVIPAIVSMHSFVPEMKGIARPWHVGVLWDADPRLSVPLIERLRAEPDLVVGDNEPYDGALQGDTIDQHATRRGLANTLIEVRNDLIATEAAAESWGRRLASLLVPLLETPDLRRIAHAGTRARERIRPR